MDNNSLKYIHALLAEVFSHGNPIDKADVLSMLRVFSQPEKAELWGYLGQHDSSLREQMKAFKAVDAA